MFLWLHKIGVVFAYLFGGICTDANIIDQKCVWNPKYPSEKDLRFRLYEWRWEDGSDEAFFMDMSVNLDIYPNTSHAVNPNTKQPLTYSFMQDKTCPKTLRDIPRMGLLKDQSICPWYHELDVDDNRFPKIMWTAICKCPRRCVGEKSRRKKCKPIEINQKVLRIKMDSKGNKACDQTNTYIFRRSVQKVSIGCMCVYDKNIVRSKKGRRRKTSD